MERSRRTLRIHLEGTFDLTHWRAVLDGLPGVPGFGPNVDTIYDVREAGFCFSAVEIRHLVDDISRAVARRAPGIRVAFAVRRDLDFGISRMIQTLCDGMPLEAMTFRSMEEAERWVARLPQEGS